MNSVSRYIKSKYPEAVVNKIRLPYKNILGFVITNGNMIVGFINTEKNLCKLINPINLNKIAKGKGIPIKKTIKSLPIINGFTDVDKVTLLRFFESEAKAEHIITKNEQDSIIRALRKNIGNTKNKYRMLYDSIMSELVIINKKYVDKVKDIQKEYNDKINSIEETKNKIINEKDGLIKELQKFKNEMEEYVKRNKCNKEDVSEICQKISKDKNEIEIKLNGLLESEKLKLEELKEKDRQIDEYNKELKVKNEELEKTKKLIDELNEEKLKILEEIKPEIERKGLNIEEMDTKIRELRNDYKKAMDEKEKIEGKLNEVITDKNKKIEEKENEIRELQEKNIENEKRINEIEEKNKKHETEKEKIITEIMNTKGGLQEKIIAYEFKIKELERIRNGLLLENKDIKQKLENLLLNDEKNIKRIRELENIESRLKEKEDALKTLTEMRYRTTDEKEKTIGNLQKEKVKLNEDINNLQEKLKEIESKKRIVENEKIILEKKMQNIKDIEIDKREEIIKNLENKINMRGTRMIELENKYSNKENELNKYKNDLSITSKNLERIKIEKDQQEREHSEREKRLNEENVKLQNQLEMLKTKTIENSRSIVDQIRERENKIKELTDLLNSSKEDFIRLKREYEEKRNELNNEIKKYEQNKNDLEEMINKNRQRIIELQNENERIKNKSVDENILKEKLKEIAEKTSKINEFENNINEMDKIINKKNEDLRVLKNDLINSENKNKELKIKIESLSVIEDKSNELIKQNEKLQRDLIEKQREIDQIIKEKTIELESQIEIKKKEFELKRNKEMEQNENAQIYEQKLKENEQIYERQKRLYEESQERIEKELNPTIAKLRNEKRELENEIDRLNKESEKSLSEKIKDFQRQVNDKNEEIKNLNENINRLQNEIKGMKDVLVDQKGLANMQIEAYKTNCQKIITVEKDEIIKRLNEYKTNYDDWLKSSQNSYKEQQIRLLDEFKSINRELEELKERNLKIKEKEGNEVQTRRITEMMKSELDNLKNEKIECDKRSKELKERLINIVQEWDILNNEIEEKFKNYRLKLIDEFKLINKGLIEVKSRENKQINQNIKDLQMEIENKTRESLQKLTEKESENNVLKSKLEELKQQNQELISDNKRLMKEKRELNEMIDKLNKDLEEDKRFVVKSQKIKIEETIDYDNCLKNYINLNNKYVNRVNAIKKIEEIIRNEGIIREKIRIQFGKYENEKEISDIVERMTKDFREVKKHTDDFIKQTDMNTGIEYINALQDPMLEKRLKEAKGMLSNEVSQKCNALTNIIDYFNEKREEYEEDEFKLINIYEDLSGAVRVFIRIKPSKEKYNTIKVNEVNGKKERAITLNCENDSGKRYGEFYGIFEENFENKNVYTGIAPLEEDQKESFENLKTGEIPNIYDSISPGLHSAFKQVEQGYSIVLFGYGSSGSGKTFTLLGDGKKIPGILHYGLSNLNNVKYIRLKNVFEQYYNSLDYTQSIPKITGRVINLFGKISFENVLTTDENIGLKSDNLNIDDINDITNKITKYRIRKDRIKETPNNKESSRSHLYMIFEIRFDNGKTGYITMIDMAGRESPIDIYKTFYPELPEDRKERVYLYDLFTITSSNREKAERNIKKIIKTEGRGEEMERILQKAIMTVENRKSEKYTPDELKYYTPDDISKVILEGIYINETINHLMYYFNKKNFGDVEIKRENIQSNLSSQYAVDKYFINPKIEDENPNLNKSNNCIMIPILKYLDNLSKTKEVGEFKPTKFIMLCMVRQEERYCNQIKETLEFAQKIKSS
jgi:chromosome segregation ATPase